MSALATAVRERVWPPSQAHEHDYRGDVEAGRAPFATRELEPEMSVCVLLRLPSHPHTHTQTSLSSSTFFSSFSSFNVFNTLTGQEAQRAERGRGRLQSAAWRPGEHGRQERTEEVWKSTTVGRRRNEHCGPTRSTMTGVAAKSCPLSNLRE
jgi:hypothetical protein